jgi:phytoene dehydrogenase-like protein
MTEHWDAVVVGAGHHGLVAASVLAERGWSVLVLEEQERAGGAVASAEVTAPGFLTDLYSAFYPLSIVSPVLQGLRLDRHGLRWRHPPQVLAHVSPDDRSVLLSRDLGVTAASVERHGRGDGDRWRGMHAQWLSVRDPLLASLLGPFPPVRAAARLLRATGPAGAAHLARLAAQGVHRLGEEEFVGDGARLLLTGNGLHADVPATSPPSALLGWLLCMIGQDHGWPVPAGGAGRLADALVGAATRRGATLRCGSRVTRVLVQDGRAVGVVDSAGREYRAGRAVLADVHALVLYRDLLAGTDLPSGLRADLDRFTCDLATIKVNWALDGPVPWTADEPRRAATVHLGVDLAGLVDGAHDLAVGRIPAHPFVLLGQMTTADPSRSPPGTESLWAYTHVPTSSVAGSDGGAVVDDQVRRMEAALERNAPGFADRVLSRTVQSPCALEASDRSLLAGAVNGGTAQLWQQLVLRPTPGTGRPETVVDRLFLASCSAHPGGSVHGAAGHNAARAALLRDRWGTRRWAAALLAAQRRVAA